MCRASTRDIIIGEWSSGDSCVNLSFPYSHYLRPYEEKAHIGQKHAQGNIDLCPHNSPFCFEPPNSTLDFCLCCVSLDFTCHKTQLVYTSFNEKEDKPWLILVCLSRRELEISHSNEGQGTDFHEVCYDDWQRERQQEAGPGKAQLQQGRGLNGVLGHVWGWGEDTGEDQRGLLMSQGSLGWHSHPYLPLNDCERYWQWRKSSQSAKEQQGVQKT